jgi:hypothetical protein
MISFAVGLPVLFKVLEQARQQVVSLFDPE